MAINYDEFDKAVDLEGLQKDYKEAEENGGGNYEEVPHGTYEVKVEKLELTASKTKGDPMVSCWFKILSGQHKNGLIFMNQVVTQGFQLHSMDEFLKSLDSGVNVFFERYSQYAQLLMDIHEAIDGKLEYALEYGENKKGYNTFKIKEIYEVE